MKVSEVWKFIAGYQHSMVRMFYCSEACMKGYSEVAKQVSMTEQSEHPTTSASASEGNIEQISMLILNNKRVTIDEVANQLQFSHGSAHEIIYYRLHFYEFCANSQMYLANSKKRCSSHFSGILKDQTFIRNEV
jgi:hypothetical protein